MELLLQYFHVCVDLWLQMAPYLLFGMAVAGVLHVVIGNDFIVRHLGRGGIGSVIKATVLGVPLPLCSCGVIPVASSLEKDGAHKSSILAFLVSTPTTGIDSIFATYALLGPLFAVFRPLAAVITGMALGMCDYVIEGKNHPQRTVTPHPARHAGQWAVRFREFLRFAFVDIPRDIGGSLGIGIAIGAAITVLIPDGMFTSMIRFPGDFFLALVIGIPLYVCATASIPVAASLLVKGFSPGAALVFLIVGPATNTVTMAFVRQKLGRLSFWIYLIAIGIVAVVLGLLFNGVWSLAGDAADLTGAGGHFMPSAVRIPAGAVLLGLLLNAVRVTSHEKCSGSCSGQRYDVEVQVEQLHCRDCRRTLESAIGRIGGVTEVSVDLSKKTVRVRGAVDAAQVCAAIRQAGFDPV